LAHHFQAHRASGTFHHAHGGFHVVRVQVLHLRFGNLTDLIARDRACGHLARSLRAGFQVGVLLQEVRHRRRVHDEGERLVLVVGNHDRSRLTLLNILGRGVERLAELHDVDATLTKRRTNRGRRRSRTRWNLKLELACNLFSHFSSAFVLCRPPNRMSGGCSWWCGRKWPAKATRPPTILRGDLSHLTSPSCGEDCSSDLLDLTEFEIYRNSTTKDRHLDLQARTLLIDLLNKAAERREWTIGNANRFADLERDRRLRTLDALLHLMQDLQRLLLRNRNRLRGPRVLTKEARHTRRILHKADHLVVQIRLHQDVAREELALRIN